MANTIPARAPQTQALETYLADATGLLVDVGRKPAGGGWQGTPGQSNFAGYAVIHGIPGGLLDGPLGDPHADSELPWQIDSYGADSNHADVVGDLVAAALLVQGLPPLVIAERTVTRVRLDVGGAARQDPDQPAIWRRFDLYRITTTPRSA